MADNETDFLGLSLVGMNDNTAQDFIKIDTAISNLTTAVVALQESPSSPGGPMDGGSF